MGKLALRQQLAVLMQRNSQPRFAAQDRLFWTMLRRLWTGSRQALILVQPETVVRRHRTGFKANWTRLLRHRVHLGRKCVNVELRELIFRLVAENPRWGALCIHGELTMLGREDDVECQGYPHLRSGCEKTVQARGPRDAYDLARCRRSLAVEASQSFSSAAPFPIEETQMRSKSATMQPALRRTGR